MRLLIAGLRNHYDHFPFGMVTFDSYEPKAKDSCYLKRKGQIRTSLICYPHLTHLFIRKMSHSLYHAALLYLTLSNFNKCWIWGTSTIKNFTHFADL